MTHGPHPPRRSRTLLGRYRNLLAALAVMLLAVLPHLTFAASTQHAMGDGPVGASATTRHAHVAHEHPGAHASPGPCHEQAGASDRTAPAKPSCCIIGCGVIGFGPQIALPRIATISHRLPPPHALRGEGGEIEPAERPPRLT